MDTNLPHRIQKMRNAFLKIKPSISIDRAIATTEVYKQYGNIPTLSLIHI